MPGRIDQKFCQSGIGWEIQHAVSIQVSEKIAVIHPGWTYRKEGDLRRRKSQGFPIQAYQPRFSRSAPAGQNDQTGRLGRNMEIVQIPFIIKESPLLYPADKPVDKGHFLIFPLLFFCLFFFLLIHYLLCLQIRCSGFFL